MELDQRKIKAIMITAFAVLGILLIFVIVSVIVIMNTENKNNNIDVSSGYKSIKQIVEAHKCKYIKDTYDARRQYQTEIKLVFKCKLYENDESNEEFYNKIIKDILKFVKYTNVKMIDETNDIQIEIICVDGKIYEIKINGIVDYFIYMDSQLEVTRYEKIKEISIMPDDIALMDLINNRWSSETNLGTRESIFKNYNICFDEGIEYKKIGSNIYNIVYTKKHVGPVINNLSVGIDLKAVEDYLGKPAFKDDELNVIGYKGGNLYAFFTKDEISIYRNVDCDYDEFWDLCDRFLNEDMSFKDYMNELTYLWGDFSEYTYDSDYMFISYPNKGIDVKLNYEEISGIVLYNNISEDINVVKNYLNHTEFVSRLKLDNIFEAEKRRIENEKNIVKAYKEFEKQLEETEDEQIAVKKSFLYKYYMDIDKSGNTITTYFISKDENNVNRELNEAVDTYVWANSEYFVYSVRGVGLYTYNVVDGIKSTLIEGRQPFKINSYENGILKFDEVNEINLGY